MRQGQQHNNHKNRMRGRNNNNNNRKGPNPLTRSYESNGGDVKIRGTALHVAEKYVQLARDAQSAGDRVAAENYLQHAEHYYRIVAAAQAQMPQPQPIYRNDEDGEEDESGESRNGAPQGGQYGNNPYANPNPYSGNRQPQQGGQYGNNPYGGQPPAYSGEQPQINGNGNGAPVARTEQPVADEPPVEQRPQGEFHGNEAGFDNRGQQGGNFGGPNQGGGRRRRRPYRENFGDRGGERNGAPASGDAFAEQTGGGEE